jgi:hypothetical protein
MQSSRYQSRDKLLPRGVYVETAIGNKMKSQLDMSLKLWQGFKMVRDPLRIQGD